MFSCIAGKTGTIINLDICFSQNDALIDYPIYTPGEIVDGYCVVHCSGKVNVDAIEARFLGCARANTYAHKEYRTQEIIYFNETQVIHDSSLGEEEEEAWLKDGMNHFKFSFCLPNNLPTSFSHFNGYIRYSVKATIIKTVFNEQVERFFTVHCPLDPSDCKPIAPLSKYVEAENFHSLCYSFRCCSNGTLTIEADTDKYVYSVGDVIKVNCLCRNLTSKIVKPEIKLVQYMKFTADHQEQKKEQEVSFDFTSPNLASNSIREFVAQIDIPKSVDDIPLSATITNCPLVQVTYCVVVALRKAKLQIPIVLENINLSETILTK
ncbi:arrestin domain-containing protein 3-like protein [Dinothrombium tinctorium]|uniref:Arrestin domain-containing protein 3-like protein n=1 Tax=Dinothrombium tinctorium TaxID=1965070 RepID=A0A3S3QEK8_9ACAR|nr:arrestin domain-containing protein 3-like protein [Dinothrombium tinctorium]RWS07881.1 arrestin domain-containing protein 3-like protein [Dinothrombium tinctorium]RWS07886.1 arrestin domain-containing protein 3-like protein [Dinothrombium tinctorium]RWS08337.1 arrestin domain-containing protein 3-like protein [Dinothrombium tinctorium]